MKRYALIDLGTNSARLFVYDVNGRDTPKKQFQTKEMVRLGDNLFLTGQLDPNAYRRTVKAFKRFRKILQEFLPDSIVAVATSAMRSAKDSDRLRKSIFKKTGIALQIITGQEEAELIAEGLLDHLSLDEDRSLFIDIGGGSTELSLAKEGILTGCCSLDIGAARFQQLYLVTVPPKTNQAGEKKMRKEIRHHLDQQPDFLKKPPCTRAVGTSGSIRALGRLMDPSDKTEASFTRQQLHALIERLRPMTREEMLEVPRLDPKRIDLILSAAIILEEICDHFQVESIHPVNYSLKDGLIHRLISGREVGRQHEIASSQ